MDPWPQRVDNPLLVVLHGGPGSSETALFRSFNADLEGAYTMVYWDQRGAGRSYRKGIPEPSMTVERFVADLDELIEKLRRPGSKGAAWCCSAIRGSSMLGVLYASRFPAKVAAYVGVGQVADMAASEGGLPTHSLWREPRSACSAQRRQAPARHRPTAT